MFPLVLVPAALAVPEVEVAALALMTFYVKHGHLIINILSETPMPVPKVSQIVARTAVRGPVKVQITDEVIKELISTRKGANSVIRGELFKWVNEHRDIVYNKKAFNDMLRIVHATKTREVLLKYIETAKEKHGTKTLADLIQGQLQ